MEEFYLPSNGAGRIHCALWTPETAPRAVVQIIHGIAEHIGRYDHFANFLTERRGKQGAIYAPRCALCLETQYFPNAMACDGFEKPILRAGDLWRHCTTLTFSGKR